MAEVVLENICKEYADPGRNKHPKVALDNISFTVKDKEFMVVVGPSGCGKSTLLRMIAGLETITSGKLLLDGQLLNEISPTERDIAMVFQNYALYPHMTVYENMAFGLKIRKLKKAAINERVLEAARMLELENELHRKPKTLSGGQRQRVAIGRAIVRRPKVFLFDEPLSNLDAKLRTQMRIELQKLHREMNATMIYVTHDQTEAMTLGQRITILNKGKLMQSDTPISLYNRPVNRFVAGFIGSPAMNFLQGSVERQNGNNDFVDEQNIFRVQLTDSPIVEHVMNAGKPVTLGIRPEHLEICDTQLTADALLTVAAVENLGNEQLIYLEYGLGNVIVRKPGFSKTARGGKIFLRLDSSRIYFFDPVTGAAV